MRAYSYQLYNNYLKRTNNSLLILINYIIAEYSERWGGDVIRSRRER